MITALEARGENVLTATFIKNKLIGEYNRRYEYSERSESTARAFKAQKKFPVNEIANFGTNCHLKSHNNNESWHNKHYCIITHITQ